MAQSRSGRKREVQSAKSSQGGESGGPRAKKKCLTDTVTVTDSKTEGKRHPSASTSNNRVGSGRSTKDKNDRNIDLMERSAKSISEATQKLAKKTKPAGKLSVKKKQHMSGKGDQSVEGSSQQSEYFTSGGSPPSIIRSSNASKLGKLKKNVESLSKNMKSDSTESLVNFDVDSIRKSESTVMTDSQPQDRAKKRLISFKREQKKLQFGKLKSNVQKLTKNSDVESSESLVEVDTLSNQVSQSLKEPLLNSEERVKKTLQHFKREQNKAKELKARCRKGCQSSNTKTKASKRKQESRTSKRQNIKSVAVVPKAESDSESEWEDVEELPDESIEEEISQIPDKVIKITLDGPDLVRKKKKCSDIEAWFKRQINKYKKETQLDIHKVHILCLLAHGFFRNGLCADIELQCYALSLIPEDILTDDLSKIDYNFINKLLLWYIKNFSFDADPQKRNKIQKTKIRAHFKIKMAASEVEYIMMFLLVLRSVGVDARLLYSLQPITHKPTDKSNKAIKQEVIEINSRDTSPDIGKNPLEPAKDKIRSAEQSGTCSFGSKRKLPLSKAVKDHGPQPKNWKSWRTAKTICYNEDNDDDAEDDHYHKAEKLGEKAKKKEKEADPDLVELSSGSDFEEEITTFRSPSQCSKAKKCKRIVSSSSSESGEMNQEGHDFWIEVYLPQGRKWFCVNCLQGTIDKPRQIESQVSKPICYILAYDKDGHVKDVTRRYDSNYMLHTRKLRVDKEWWDITLLPYQVKDFRDEEEDVQLEVRMLKQPLPKSISDFKNHPLYVLKRHLLKFEAIYPESSIPVGYIKSEPVYARDCVHTLHTRETWLREGRLVRVKEKPFKMVKARKRRNDPVQNSEMPLSECFGFWQTEEYMPPPVYNGRVPRNDYGNIEMFKPWMLPPGAVYLQLPGLNRIAKKLDIDCVPAMVGWEVGRGGWNHPVLDGFVVCEEHKDLLLAAWDEEQEILKEKQAEKREKRALSNWKLLTRGLQIQERLRQRFDLKTEKEKKKEVTSVTITQEKADDVQMSWPRKVDELLHPKNKHEKPSLFPFEQL